MQSVGGGDGVLHNGPGRDDVIAAGGGFEALLGHGGTVAIATIERQSLCIVMARSSGSCR